MKNKNLLKKAISGLILSTMAFTTMCPVISWAEKLSIQQTQKIKNVSLKKLVKLKENITMAEYKIKTGQSALEVEREVEYALLQ